MGNCLSSQARTQPGDDAAPLPALHACSKTVSATATITKSLKADIAAVLTDLLPAWKSPTPNDLDVSVISGGISNALYRVALTRVTASPFEAVSPPEDGPAYLQQVVVLRVYGNNTEKFVDREMEVETMRTLYRHGFGPAVLGVFANGRVESYLTGMVCLSPDDLGKEEMSTRIAETLGRFHSLSSHKSGGRSVEFPVARPDEPGQRPGTPFEKTRSWLKTSKTLADEGGYTKRQQEIWEGLDVDSILEELRQLEAKALKLKSPLAFTHNDLLSGNIMVDADTMTFIDFEYADWAPRGFDLGNHFCEYAGFDCDYSKYPDEPRGFVRAYLRVYEGATPSEAKVAQVVREANLFALAAHLYWGAWCMLQAAWSDIDFDYMKYAKLRVDEFYRRKRDWACV